MNERDDSEARRSILEDLDCNMLVEAAAGTGKTTALIGRMLAVIGSGRAALGRMVAVTFTDKAAGEMKLRLRSELERARAATQTDDERGAERRQRFERALGELETAHIGTIHAFCSDLLRERPIEAGVDPAFEVHAEDEAARLFERVFDRWFSEVLESPPEGVRRILRRSGGRSAPSEQLRGAAAALKEQRDFHAAWRRPELDRRAEIDRAVAAVVELAELSRAGAPNDNLTRDLGELRRFGDELAQSEALAGGKRDYDLLEHALAELLRRTNWKRKGRGGSFAPGLPRQDVLTRREAVRKHLEALKALLSADLAACLQRDLRDVIARYEAHKAEVGVLDFLDLLLCTRDLLRRDATIRAALQRRFSHIFVDEFQDTDPLQAEILLMLAADEVEHTDWAAALEAPRIAPGKLFVVGDPKQSIYSFRRADVALYARVKEMLRAQGALILSLTRSYRAVENLQRAINTAFSLAMEAGRDAGQAEYQPLSPVRPTPEDRPSLIALPVPRPYNGWGNVGSMAVSASVPDAVGAFIDWLVHHSGYRVREHDGDVPVGARHVCLLFRQFRGYGEETTRPYVRALEARRIPHVLVGGRSFHGREEVLCLRAALFAIEWPDDDLHVYATLRGPLFSLADEALLDYRHAVGSLHPLRPVAIGELEGTRREVAEALGILRELHLLRNRRVIGETINRLLSATRAHAGFAIWPTGEQALGNVSRIVDMARRFEARGATSFRAFVERLEEEAQRGQASEAPVIEEGVEGVRVMTVHRAKGLEFPVVILCDPTTPRSRAEPSRHADTERGLLATQLAGCVPLELMERADELRAREEAEEIRIAYVAATRARDLLVVPAVGDQRIGGWVDVLHPALYPGPDERRSPEPAPGCPPFGQDSVYDWPARATRRPEDSVAPGRHRPLHGEHDVVWWDPRALVLDHRPLGGLRQTELLKEGEGDRRQSMGQQSHDAWQARRERALHAGAQPTLIARTVTALSLDEDESAPAAAAGGDERAPAVMMVEVERAGRPRGKRFGSLVHAVLADALDHGRDSEPAALAKLHGRLLGATDDEMTAAAIAVEAALAHELLREAQKSSERRAETSLCVRLPDGTLAEGIADLVFRRRGPNGPCWVVIDFKTDADPGAAPAYAKQLAYYARAVELATGEPADCVLLGV